MSTKIYLSTALTPIRGDEWLTPLASIMGDDWVAEYRNCNKNDAEGEEHYARIQIVKNTKLGADKGYESLGQALINVKTKQPIRYSRFAIEFDQISLSCHTVFSAFADYNFWMGRLSSDDELQGVFYPQIRSITVFCNYCKAVEAQTKDVLLNSVKMESNCTRLVLEYQFKKDSIIVQESRSIEGCCATILRAC